MQKQKEKNKMYLDLKEKKSLIVLVLAVALVIGTIAYYTHKSSVLSSSLKADGSNKVEEIESLRDSYLSPSKKQVTVGFSKREVSNNDEFDILVNQTGDIKLQDIMEKEDYDYLVYRYFEIKYNKLLDKKQEIAKLDEALEKEEKIGLNLLENKKITKQQYKDILVNLKKDFEKKKEPLFDGLEYIKNKSISLNRGKIKQIALDFKKDRNSYEKLSENSRNRSLLFSQLFGKNYRDSHKSLAYDLNKILESKNKITLLDLFSNVELEIKFETELIDRLDRVKKIKYQLEYLIENTANRTDILELEKERNAVSKEQVLIKKLVYNLDIQTPFKLDMEYRVLNYQILKSDDKNEIIELINKFKNLRYENGRNVVYQKTIDELLAKKSREDQLLNDYEIRMEEYRIKKEKEKQALKDFVFENALNKK
jgi:hypothetical protein